jgi:EpsI family protein
MNTLTGTRFWLTILLFVATSALLYGRGDKDRQVGREPLSSVPNQVAQWTGKDRNIDQRVLDVLGSGEFLSRLYTSGSAEPPVDLFIGYFPSQRSGSSIHSPKNCLPGAGWYFESAKHDDIVAANGRPYNVGEYVISNGSVRQYVLYWYQAHGRSVASEYWAKFYLVDDAIRMNRTDGALVRVITPLAPDEDLAKARERVVGFTAQLAPQLHRFIPD